MRTKVKICGITCEGDVSILNRCLPDYAGFVFADSRRRVTADIAKKLADSLNPLVKKAGVFVNMEIERLCEIVNTASLDVVQLHGDEDRDFIDRLRCCIDNRIQVWKAVKPDNNISISGLPDYRADLYLADTYVKGRHGGTGICFDWKLLMGFDNRSSIILAGGLTPVNVTEAITIVRPYGVDVSSGVETDGKKDANLVEKFITSVRNMEEV